jgi:hypothetical protein
MPYFILNCKRATIMPYDLKSELITKFGFTFGIHEKMFAIGTVDFVAIRAR